MSRAQRGRLILCRSQTEGVFYALMVGTTESFALVFAAVLGMSNSQIGILSTVPVLLGSIFQWLIPRWVRPEKVIPVTLTLYGVQALGLLVLIFATGRDEPFLWILLALFLYWAGGLSVGPLWLAWIKERIPMVTMGKVLARRNAVVSVATLAAFVASALYLDLKEDSTAAFVLLFSVGALARFGALFSQSWAAKDPLNWNEDWESPERHSLSKNFSRAVLCMIALTAVFRFTVALSSPYFLTYMLGELHFTSLDYVIVTSAAFMGRFLFMSGWGRASGGRRPFLGIQIACLGIAAIPALWTLSSNLYYLVLLELLGGVLWGGFEICTALILQRFTSKKTLRIVAKHLALMNLFAVVGALCGAVLLKNGYNYLDIFSISSILRLLLSIAMILTFAWLRVTRSTVADFGVYLTTVLSLRPSFANVGRSLKVQVGRGRHHKVRGRLINSEKKP